MTANKFLAWITFSLFLLSAGIILFLLIASPLVNEYIENPINIVFVISALSLLAVILGFLSFKLPQAKVGAIGSLIVLLFTLYIIPVDRELTIETPQPEISLQAQNIHTGIAGIDTVIDTVLAGDQNDVSHLLQFIQLACTHADGLGGPPKCEDGETEGTVVSVFPFLGPEGHHMRYSDLGDWVGIPATGVYTVYRVSPGAYSDEFYPAGKYAVVFITTEESLLIAVQVTDGKIVRIDNKLGSPPEINLKRDASEIILAPPE